MNTERIKGEYNQEDRCLGYNEGRKGTKDCDGRVARGEKNGISDRKRTEKKGTRGKGSHDCKEVEYIILLPRLHSTLITMDATVSNYMF